MCKYSNSGNSSVDSCVRCSLSILSSSVEYFLGCFVYISDLCYARKPQGSNWHGPTEMRRLVYQSLPKEETPSSCCLVCKATKFCCIRVTVHTLLLNDKVSCGRRTGWNTSSMWKHGWPLHKWAPKQTSCSRQALRCFLPILTQRYTYTWWWFQNPEQDLIIHKVIRLKYGQTYSLRHSKL